MKLRYKIAGFLAVAAGLWVYFDKPTPVTIPPNTPAIIETGPGGTTVTTPEGKKKLPEYGHGTEIEKKPKGEVVIRPKIKGFTHDFGISTDFQRIGLGYEPFFYRRFHALIGVNMWHMAHQEFDMRFYVAAAYRIPWMKLNNVSLYAGIDNRKVVTGGLFLRFGNSL